MITGSPLIIPTEALSKNFRRNYSRIFRRKRKKIHQKISKKKVFESKTISLIYNSTGNLEEIKKFGTFFDKKI